MRYNTEAKYLSEVGEVSERYPESGLMKEVVVKYDRLENICDILKPRDNRGVIGFDEESFNSVGGMNV